MSRRRLQFRFANYVALVILTACSARGQFDGLPIAPTSPTWQEANKVAICSQLFQAVDERCLAVGTNIVPRPVIIQTFLCDWDPVNMIFTNIVTTNCVGPFTSVGKGGHVFTNYPPITKFFIGSLSCCQYFSSSFVLYTRGSLLECP